MTRGSLEPRGKGWRPGSFGDRKGEKKNLDRETREPETMPKIPRP